MKFTVRRVLPFAAGAVIAASGFAFMAANTVQTTGAGEGQGTVSGYTINHISYNTNTSADGCTNDGRVCQVSFQAWATASISEPVAANAYVRFVNGSGAGLTQWEKCQFAGTPGAGDAPGSGYANPSSWNCNFTPPIGNYPIAGLQVRATS